MSASTPATQWREVDVSAVLVGAWAPHDLVLITTISMCELVEVREVLAWLSSEAAPNSQDISFVARPVISG